MFSIFLTGMMAFSCSSQNQQETMRHPPESPDSTVKLFLCGDVMTARGIDQILPHSVNPVLYESYVKDARQYVTLAERKSGPVPAEVDYAYIWGEAMEVWEKNAPDLRLINLETSITTNSEPWPGKGIHYRMHPKNVKVLQAARIDHCSLGNNHVIDWSRPGLTETMETLETADIKFSGVGENERSAARPSVLTTEKGRVLVFSYGSPTSGIPEQWAAESSLSGVNFLEDLDEQSVEDIKEQIATYHKEGDVVIFSIHWGGNWGYDVSDRQRNFAKMLIDEAGVDIIYGHSSHHPMGIEVYKDRLILYGAGDFINDYEGIGGHQEYRGELTLMYFPQLNSKTGKLEALKIIPMEVSQLQLQSAESDDAMWIRDILNREGKKFGTSVNIENGALWLHW